jgi:hypothetical protein
MGCQFHPSRPIGPFPSRYESVMLNGRLRGDRKFQHREIIAWKPLWRAVETDHAGRFPSFPKSIKIDPFSLQNSPSRLGSPARTSPVND